MKLSCWGLPVQLLPCSAFGDSVQSLPWSIPVCVSTGAAGSHLTARCYLKHFVIFFFFFFLVLTQLKFSPGAGCSRRAMGSPGCWALGRVLGWGAGGEPYAALISQAWQDDGASCGWGTRGLCTCSP